MAVPVHVVMAEATSDDAERRTIADLRDAPTVQIDGDDQLEPTDDDSDDDELRMTLTAMTTIGDTAAPTGLARATTLPPVDADAVAAPSLTTASGGGRRWMAASAGVVLVGGLVAVLALWLGSRDGDEGDTETSPAGGRLAAPHVAAPPWP